MLYEVITEEINRASAVGIRTFMVLVIIIYPCCCWGCTWIFQVRLFISEPASLPAPHTGLNLLPEKFHCRLLRLHETEAWQLVAYIPVGQPHCRFLAGGGISIKWNEPLNPWLLSHSVKFNSFPANNFSFLRNFLCAEHIEPVCSQQMDLENWSTKCEP